MPGFLIHASRFRCCLAEDSCNDTSECADEESGFLVGAACPPAAAHAPLPAGPPGPLRQKGARRGRLPGSQHQSASIAPRGSTPVVSSPLHAALRPPGDPSPSGLSTSDHPSSSTPTPGSRRSTCPVGSRPLLLGSRDSGESLMGWGRAPRGVAMRRHGCREKPPRSASPAPASSLCSAQPAACTRRPRPASARARRWARWAQVGAGGLSGRRAALRPRSP